MKFNVMLKAVKNFWFAGETYETLLPGYKEDIRNMASALLEYVMPKSDDDEEIAKSFFSFVSNKKDWDDLREEHKENIKKNVRYFRKVFQVQLDIPAMARACANTFAQDTRYEKCDPAMQLVWQNAIKAALVAGTSGEVYPEQVQGPYEVFPWDGKVRVKLSKGCTGRLDIDLTNADGVKIGINLGDDSKKFAREMSAWLADFAGLNISKELARVKKSRARAFQQNKVLSEALYTAHIGELRDHTVPAGVEDVLKMVTAAHYGWSHDSGIHVGAHDAAKFTPYATAIRDAVLAGVAVENQSHYPPDAYERHHCYRCKSKIGTRKYCPEASPGSPCAIFLPRKVEAPRPAPVWADDQIEALARVLRAAWDEAYRMPSSLAKGYTCQAHAAVEFMRVGPPEDGALVLSGERLQQYLDWRAGQEKLDVELKAQLDSLPKSERNNRLKNMFESLSAEYSTEPPAHRVDPDAWKTPIDGENNGPDLHDDTDSEGIKAILVLSADEWLYFSPEQAAKYGAWLVSYAGAHGYSVDLGQCGARTRAADTAISQEYDHQHSCPTRAEAEAKIADLDQIRGPRPPAYDAFVDWLLPQLPEGESEPKCNVCKDAHPFCSKCMSPNFSPPESIAALEALARIGKHAHCTSPFGQKWIDAAAAILRAAQAYVDMETNTTYTLPGGGDMWANKSGLDFLNSRIRYRVAVPSSPNSEMQLCINRRNRRIEALKALVKKWKSKATAVPNRLPSARDLYEVYWKTTDRDRGGLYANSPMNQFEKEGFEAMLTALRPWLREPTGWELDIQPQVEYEAGSSGIYFAEQCDIDWLKSRIRPTFECAECKECRKTNEDLRGRIYAARAALEGE